MGIAITEESRLQHAIRRRPDTGDEMTRIESRVLGLREEIVRRPIEHQLSDGNQRIVTVIPDLGQIERIDAVRRGVTLRHYLHVECPGREVLALDRVVDRKSTRLNSSHGYISYAVFCLKKKKKNKERLVIIKKITTNTNDKIT